MRTLFTWVYGKYYLKSCIFGFKYYITFPGWQVVESVQFMKKFLDDNPLCVCHDEVSAIKKMLGDNDDIRLKQKQSQIVITLRQLDYSVQLRFHIGENYPQTLTQ